MRIGIGLPAAIPGVPSSAVGEWAAAAEASGFESLGVQATDSPDLWMSS